MKYYKLPFLKSQEGRVRGMLKLAQQMRPDLVEEAFLQVIEEDDLSDIEIEAGVSLVLYADEKTYIVAQQYGFSGGQEVAEIPAAADDYFDI